MEAAQPLTIVDVRTADGLTLHGGFGAAQPVPRAAGIDAVLLMHGVASSFVTTLAPALTEPFAAHGYATLRANNRGHDIVARGSATQPYLGAAFERLDESVADWRAWLDWLGARGYRRILLCGHSLGGVKTAYMLATAGHPLVAGCCLFSPPRFSYASWMASPRADEFREHLARAQALVDAGTPDALFPATMPIATIVSAAAYIAKYGPDAPFDVFAHLVRIALPTITFTGDREFEGVDFRDHPAQYEAALRRKANLVHHVVPGGNHFYHGCEGWVAERLLAWLCETFPAD
jgi:pimeloyl-ACP methyl ester carboxylesterase